MDQKMWWAHQIVAQCRRARIEPVNALLATALDSRFAKKSRLQNHDHTQCCQREALMSPNANFEPVDMPLHDSTLTSSP